METIYGTYTRQICSNCKNRNTNLCEVITDIDGTLKCAYYIKEKNIEGYKKFKGTTAKQEKPIMKQIV